MPAKPRPRWSRRRIVLGTGLVCVPLAALAGWLLVQARTAQADLTAAQAAVARLRTDLTGGGQPSGQVLSEIREHTRAARQATSDPAWSAVAYLPLAGRPFRTAQGLSVAVDQVAADVLPDVMRLREMADPGKVLHDDGAVDLDVLAQADPVLARIQHNLDRIQANLRGLPSSTGLDRLDTASRQLTGQVTRMAASAKTAGTTARLLVPALGASGPRSYFLAFQTNAEARGTGGLVGAFGILTADHGRITFHDVSSNDALTAAPAPVADFGPEFERQYAAAQSTRLLANSNLSAHFPYAAQVWVGLWRQRTGQQLDGAIATDPVGLGRLLEAIGPVALPGGEQLTAANAVDLTESTSYARYTDPPARKRFLVQVAKAVGDALLHGRHDPAALLQALGHNARDGRLRMWSGDGTTQTVLEQSALAGSVPQDPGPFSALVVNNSAGTKLDYYLDRSLTYELGPCRSGSRASTVRIKLTNRAPAAGLPAYVTNRTDNPLSPQPLGSTRTWVSLYASVGAQLSHASMGGRPLLMSASVERKHLVLASEVELRPGEVQEMEIHLREPASDRAPVVPVQPLARPQTTRLVTASCQEAS